MNLLSYTTTTICRDVVQFSVTLSVVMLQSLHRRPLTRANMRHAEVATLQGEAGKGKALVCIRRYRSLL